MTSFRNFLLQLIPPKPWRPIVSILIGIFVGLAAFTADFSNAISYASDNPTACINCHIMNPQYITWQHSSHREVAHCNDCHVPQNNIFMKYGFKAMDGLYHSYVFTTRTEPEIIVARKASADVIQSNCVRCHANQVTDAKMMTFVANHSENRIERTCWDCHRDIPHSRIKGTSSVGFQLEPLDVRKDEHTIYPTWLKTLD